MILTRSFILILLMFISFTKAIGFVEEETTVSKPCRIKQHVRKLKKRMVSSFSSHKTRRKKAKFKKSCSPFKFNVNDYKMMSDAFIEAYEMLQVKYEKEVEQHNQTREELRIAVSGKREAEEALEMLKKEVNNLANKWEHQITQHKREYQHEVLMMGKKLEICEKSLAIWKNKESQICFTKKRQNKKRNNSKEMCKNKTKKSKNKTRKCKKRPTRSTWYTDRSDHEENIVIGMAAPE